MPEALVREETAALFFRDQLVTAMEHQKVVDVGLHGVLPRPPARPASRAATPAGARAGLRRDAARDAVRAGPRRRRASSGALLLRATADTALFVSGFFADSLPGGHGDLRYYASLGGRAYARLGREHTRGPVGHRVFAELSARFLEFVDVLVGGRPRRRGWATPRSVMRLYERWRRRAAARAAALLAEQGITPGRPGGGPAPLSAAGPRRTASASSPSTCSVGSRRSTLSSPRRR